MAELRQVYSVVDTRDRILESALAVFAAVGFHGATIREIAKRADVSQGLVHHHFKDKESLWNIVGERISDEFLQEVFAAIDDATPEAETVSRLVTAYMAYWRDHPGSLRFNLWRVLGAPEDERRSRSEKLNARSVPIFRKAQEAGLIRGDISAGLAMITTGALIQFFLHSSIEVEDAFAVTGDKVPDQEAFIGYLLSLIAPKTRTATDTSQ